MSSRLATVKLDDALDPLTEVLQSLQQCAREHRAFVIIEDVVTGRFVQFVGSDSEPLWFDAPQLGIVNNGPKFNESLVAAAYALQQLRGAHRLPGTADLTITFESTGTERRS